jgi:hypothetical protein
MRAVKAVRARGSIDDPNPIPRSMSMALSKVRNSKLWPPDGTRLLHGCILPCMLASSFETTGEERGLAIGITHNT